MVSKFFIERPILSWVIAIFMMLFGAICLFRLEISRYPNIAPPAVRVSLNYPGASAYTLETSVSQVIEQQMTGLDHLLYFSSRANSEGRVTLSFLFDPKVDADVAQMQIQNRLDSIVRKLPDVVQKNGISVHKVSDDTLVRIAFYAEDGSMSQEDIADFLSSVVFDPISRINGVGAADLSGSQYAIRIWLDMQKLVGYKLDPYDVQKAIETQNKQVSVGQLGAMPNVDGQSINVVVQARSILQSLKEFENILVYVDENGGAVYLKDVARIEMGRENYNYFGNFNGRPSASISVELSDGANAVETQESIDKLLQSLKVNFPKKLTYAYSYNTVPFVKASLYEVSKALVEALILVALVIGIFLKDLRSTIVVCITIPVVLLGTMVVLYAFNYSINTLTMFAMVLSVGLLVDDAIVVVENVNRLIYNEGKRPKEAAIISMQEISSALFGVGLVIVAVFTPMGFFDGAVGNIYRQFSLTIVSSMLMSIFCAIVITPSLCAQLIKFNTQKQLGTYGNLYFLNRIGNRCKNVYGNIIHYLLQRRYIAISLLLISSVASYFMFLAIPTSFLPEDDQGVISGRIVLPATSTMDKTQDIALKVQDYFLLEEKDAVDSVTLTLGSAGGSLRGQSTAFISIHLKDWKERVSDDLSAFAILDRAKKRFDNFSDAKITFYLPASVSGLGSSSGFSVNVLNISGNSHEQFVSDIADIVKRANESYLLYNVRAEILDDTPQLKIHIDDLKVGLFNLDIDSINENLEIALGGKYVNDFIDRGRIKRVYMQADANFRSVPSDLSKIYFKNRNGQMVSFDSIGNTSWTYGPASTERFNGVSSINLVGDPASSVSTGQAMKEIVKIITSSPGNYSYAWSGASFQEVDSGHKMPFLFVISAIIVFLCLAALYESWTIPFSVVLIVPIGVIGALSFIMLRNFNNDIYLQIALLTTGGLACKNAILIVEYASYFVKKGKSLMDAAYMASMMRFRPIVMTSAAFLLGVMPLMFAKGAGAASERAIGTAVVGGTLTATIIGIILVPCFFVTVSSVFKSKKESTENSNKNL